VLLLLLRWCIRWNAANFGVSEPLFTYLHWTLEHYNNYKLILRECNHRLSINCKHTLLIPKELFRYPSHRSIQSLLFLNSVKLFTHVEYLPLMLSLYPMTLASASRKDFTLSKVCDLQLFSTQSTSHQHNVPVNINSQTEHQHELPVRFIETVWSPQHETFTSKALHFL
jgi:hypothetical protein